MRDKNFILGAGLSGLIASYYLKLPIISKDIGGQLKTKFMLGSRYIYDKPECRALLDNLGIDYNLKVVKMGYYMKNKLYSLPPQGFRAKYYFKTRGIKTKKIPNSIMSENRRVIKTLVVDFKKLIEKLSSSKVVIMRAEVKKIDVCQKKLIFDNYELKYNKLISTIPAPIFLRLAGLTNNLKYLPIVFVKIKKSFDFKGFDYIYCCDKSFNRITNYGNYEVYEFANSLVNLPKENILATHSLPFGKIQQENFSYNNRFVSFLGRYAEWKRAIKIHDVIQKARALKKWINS